MTAKKQPTVTVAYHESVCNLMRFRKDCARIDLEFEKSMRWIYAAWGYMVAILLYWILTVIFK